MMEGHARPGFSIRRGSSADFDAVAQLRSSVAEEGIWIGAEAPVQWTDQVRQAWCQTADDENHGVWLLAQDDAGRLIGLLTITRAGTGLADFAMMVAASQRGHGVGGALLDEAVSLCRDLKLSKLNCQVWPHNGGAISLYLSRGFEIEGRRRRHWRRRNGELWDAVLMGLVFDDHSPGSGLPDAQVIATHPTRRDSSSKG